MDKKQAFLKRLQEIFDISGEEISGDTALPGDMWDSLELLAVSAAIDEVFDMVVSIKVLKNCKTIGQILEVVEAKANE